MFQRSALQTALLIATMALATACTAKAPETASVATTADAAATPAVATAAEAAAAASAATADAAAAAATTTPVDAAATTAATDAAAAAAPAGDVPREGIDYSVIDTPDEPSGSKVQVVEVFGYGCVHCADFQPDLSAWLKKKPADVQFSYLPGPFGGLPDAFERAFYAAQAMGVLEKSHDLIFKAVHQDKRVQTAAAVPNLYKDFGVDPKVFAATMQSFAVSAKVNAGNDQAMRWGVDGTPTVVVDGKYRAQMTRDRGPQGMLHTIDWLVAKQRPAHAGH